MKFKKAFAWILAVAMIISLMPSMAFASTTNTVAAVPTVKADAKIPSDTVVTLNVDDKSWDPDTQKIKLTLENATWVDNPASASVDKLLDGAGNPVIEVEASTGGAITLALVTVDDSSAEFKFTTTDELVKNDYITLTIPANAIKSGTEDGEVVLNINGLDSKVSSKALTIATVGTSTTTATVTGTPKTFPRQTVKVNVDAITGSITSDAGTTIELRETAVNSILVGSSQEVEFKLPKGVNWDSDIEANPNKYFDGDLYGGTSAIDIVDGRTLVVTLLMSGDNDVRNVLTLKPAFEITRNANEGDIAVQIVCKSAFDRAGVETAGIADASDLVVAKYGSESVTVSTVDEIPTIIAGYEKDAKDKSFIISVTVAESMKDALADNRYVDFELPDEVQISGIIKSKTNSGAKEPAKVTIGNLANTALDIGSEAKVEAENTSEFSWEVKGLENAWKAQGANKVTFEIPVTVEADYVGDITLNVTGPKAGVEDTELVVATVEAPITVTTATTEVKNGVQAQELAEITITEAYAGYIGSNGFSPASSTNTAITLVLDDLGLENSLVFDTATVEVTEGDLELGKVKITDDGVIEINIKEESTKASTIVVSGIKASLNRTLPEGGYTLLVGGNAIVKNDNYLDNDGKDGDFSDYTVKSADYIVITTPAEGGVYNSVDSTFVIGETSFTVNGEAYEMDAAAYIDSNDRTMVPIRYFAMACGIPEDAISWDQATQTATITTPARVVKITMGSDVIWVSDGTNIQMDTVAVNKDDRIYVPARFMANALGYEVEWDAATRTVSIY